MNLAPGILERKRSAAIRAVGQNPTAAFHGLRLEAYSKPLRVASPFLLLADSADLRAQRGLADALGLLVRFHEPLLHEELAPTDPLERIIFDGLEQLRCLALAPDLAGVGFNLRRAFEFWSESAEAKGVAESGFGLSVFTVIHMVAVRLGQSMPTETVDAIIENSRAALAKLVGHALRKIAATAHSQGLYAECAREISRLIVEMQSDTTGDSNAQSAARYQMLLPPDWPPEPPDGDGSDAASAQSAIDWANASPQGSHGAEPFRYKVFAKRYDQTVSGADLYSHRLLVAARRRLDAEVASQPIAVHRIAAYIREHFVAPRVDGWRADCVDGRLNPGRLGQLVTTHDPRSLYQLPHNRTTANTALTILIDNSGSMKEKANGSLALIADTLCRALDLAGVSSEILGHTTASWAGGSSIALWRDMGCPRDPGRVAELLHIVYKPSESSWRRYRRSIAALGEHGHYRESVTGEAILWAHGRLLRRSERRKLLLVITDGGPGEAATSRCNHADYLGDHLVSVVTSIEQNSPVEIAMISFGSSLSGLCARFEHLDLDGPVEMGHYRAVLGLFNR